MPFLPAPLSVTAKTTAISAFLPEVMNCLTPFSTYSLALALGARGDRRGVGADLRLGERERAQHLSLREGLQKLLLSAPSLP